MDQKVTQSKACLMIFLARFGYFVFKQPEALDYADEGGPTDACSPNMSNGRGPFKYRVYQFGDNIQFF